jgi:hypothetical protein
MTIVRNARVSDLVTTDHTARQSKSLLCRWIDDRNRTSSACVHPREALLRAQVGPRFSGVTTAVYCRHTREHGSCLLGLVYACYCAAYCS